MKRARRLSRSQSILLWPCLFSLCVLPDGIAASQRNDRSLPSHPCAAASAANPVYFETFSAEWSWSPDGASVVYDRSVGDVSQLRVHHLATGKMQCITSGEFYDTQPSWSRSGDRIAFVRRIEGVSQVHFLNTRDGSVDAVTNPSLRSEYPAFSRDGKKLAYVRFAPDNPRRRFVVVRELASGEEQVVFDSPFGLNNLSWSPDDAEVLFYSIDEEGWNDIYAAKANGSGVTRLTHNTVTDSYSAEYSPNGDRLLFSQGSEDSPYHRWFNYDLYEKEVATGAVRRLTWAFHADDRGHYSPDGRTIGFVTRRSGYAEIFLMDADGGNLRAVTEQPDGELSRLIRERGVREGQARFDASRKATPNASLIGERVAFILTRQLLAKGQMEDAVAVARMSALTHPESWWALTAQGEALLASGNRQAATQTLRRSLAIYPNQFQLVFLLGFQDFLGLLDSINGIWKQKRSDVLDLVHRLQTRGEFLSALTLLRRLDKVHPNDPDVLSRLARTQMMLGDHSSAIATYRRVLQLDPANRGAAFHLSRIQAVREPGASAR